MSIDGNTPIDMSEPQFTQKEASQISGLPNKTINNWIDRGYLQLSTIGGRVIPGRRLYSIMDMIRMAVMCECNALASVPPSGLTEISNNIIHQVWTETERDGNGQLVRGASSYYVVHHDTEKGKTIGNWYFQMPDGGDFYDRDPKLYSTTAQTVGLPRHACLMIPVSRIAGRVFLKATDLLGEAD